MSDFNYDRAQLSALGAFVAHSRSLSTVKKVELNENEEKPQQNQGVTQREVQLELDLRDPKQLRLEF